VANGVANATAVRFQVYSDAQGIGGAIFYNAVNQGGGVWRFDINLAAHPGIGNINVNVYMDNPGFSTVFCDSASFVRLNTGVIQVFSEDEFAAPLNTSWTFSCPLTNPACPTAPLTGTNQSSGVYSDVPYSTWTIQPADKPGYDWTVVPNQTQPLN
jgi:hypothetical protein